MSDNPEGINPSQPKTPKEKLDTALENALKLPPEKQQAEIDFLAKTESQFADEGKLPGVPAKQGTKAETFYSDDTGSVTAKQERALGQEAVVEKVK